MGILRLDLHCDYDRLHELVNEHKSIRQMLGHSSFLDEPSYSLHCLKDNVRLLTPELLDEINELIVNAGHALLGKKKEAEALRGRCDSFVVETDVHYPTDINLLYDAVRKVIQLTAQLGEHVNLSDWRQYKYNVKQVKTHMRIVQKKKRVSGKTEEQKEKACETMKQAHEELLLLSEKFLKKSSETLSTLSGESLGTVVLGLIESIAYFVNHAERQIEQIRRRVLEDTPIAHEEKVFSLFEPHTEWISKGKAGVPVELGLRVCLLEEQHQFILHHRVMERETDSEITVPMVVESKAKFMHLNSCSFDKGFHSKENQEELKKYLEAVGLKRKGKLSQAGRELESSESFKKARYKHAAVESAINALETHGLDKCQDEGLDGFKRYVALAVVTRNIHRIGDIIFRREQKKLLRQRKHNCDEIALPLAA